MNLQIVNSEVQFDFPLEATGSNPVKGELVKPISDKLQYRVKVSYTVRPYPPQA